MKWLRFSIFDLMVLVALAAADLVLWRVFSAANFHPRAFAELVIVGVLPMANLVALGMIRVVRTRPGEYGSRRFWAGFVTFGGAALFLFLVCGFFAGDSIHNAVDDLVRPLVRAGAPPLFVIFPGLLLPQLAFALFGGWIAGRSVEMTRGELTQ